MRNSEYILLGMIVATVLIGGVFQLGNSSSPVGAQEEATQIPEPPSERITDPNSDRFRKWVEFYIHLRINEIRTDNGLEPLEFHESLRGVARSHSEDMAARNFYAHENPDGDDPGDRFEDAGYSCGGPGENIDMSYYDTLVETNYAESETYESAEELADGIVKQWMNSTGHRENILNPDFEAEGIGIYYAGGENKTVYTTQNFCRP